MRFVSNAMLFVIACILFTLPCDSGFAEEIDTSLAVKNTCEAVLWYDIRLLEVEGRGWTETAEFYDRLPAKAEGVVREPVWRLSQHSAGMCVRFVTDAATIKARWNLRFENLAMPHMPATGVSGLDLYVKANSGQWRWLANGRPTEFPANTAHLVDGIPEDAREYMLYLPLYNGVTSVEIGIPEGNILAEAEQYDSGRRKPIVFYGTSITQGGCASRPGMVHTAILGRWLNHPVINLGFSGNGIMEPELAELLAELDPAVYILDCLPNLSPEQVAERTEPFVRILHKAHPTTPIVLVEDRSYTDSFLVTSKRTRNTDSRKALRDTYERLKEAGDDNLYYIYGETLLGDDGEATVDSSHPTDLGFFRQAEAFYSVLDPILQNKRYDTKSYAEFLQTLDMMEKESILKARDKFLENFSDASDDISAGAFRQFEKFYRNTVRTSNLIFFMPRNFVSEQYKNKNRYKKEYQELLNDILPIGINGTIVTSEILQKDPLAHFENCDAAFKNGIKEKYGLILDELYEFKKCGMKFIWGEGDWYITEDPGFLFAVSSSLKGEFQEFTRFRAEESKQRMAQDAMLLLSWDELRQRIIRWENFAKNHPGISETESKIKPNLHRMVQWYLTGIDNTRTYDYNDNYGGTAKINPELRKSYELFIKENTDSIYYPLIQGVYDILVKHDFKCQSELGNFIINNGFQVYYWRKLLKNE